jgi:heme-degrading monooxygenase HmoA
MQMLTRIWNYRTALENAGRFEVFETNFGLPMMHGQPGCLGVELIRRRDGGDSTKAAAEYCMISLWESYELLQAALSSQSWREEIELFLAQGFGEGNGTNAVYETVARTP